MPFERCVKIAIVQQEKNDQIYRWNAIDNSS